MKKLTTTLSAILILLVVYTSPISYQDWKEKGNYFWGGFEGFVNYYSSQTEERKAEIKEKGYYDVNVFNGTEDILEWKENNDLDQDWTYVVE